MSKNKFPGLLGSHTVTSLLATPLLLASLALAATPARPRQSPSQTQSVVEAARNTRERIANSTRHPKIITNDDLEVQYSLPSAALPLQSATTETPAPPATGCDSPEAKRLKTELQATQQQLDQLRHELYSQAQVISGNDLDLTHFKPGYSGFFVGAPPLSDSQPPIPARVTEAELDDKVASLTKAVRLACEYP
jgi:hypothetical protein